MLTLIAVSHCYTDDQRHTETAESFVSGSMCRLDLALEEWMLAFNFVYLISLTNDNV